MYIENKNFAFPAWMMGLLYFYILETSPSNLKFTYKPPLQQHPSYMYDALEHVQGIPMGRYCNVECTPRVQAPSFQQVPHFS